MIEYDPDAGGVTVQHAGAVAVLEQFAALDPLVHLVHTEHTRISVCFRIHIREVKKYLCVGNNSYSNSK